MSPPDEILAENELTPRIRKILSHWYRFTLRGALVPDPTAEIDDLEQEHCASPIAWIADYNCLSAGFVGSRRDTRVKCDLVRKSCTTALEPPLSARKIPRHSVYPPSTPGNSAG